MGICNFDGQSFIQVFYISLIDCVTDTILASKVILLIKDKNKLPALIKLAFLWREATIKNEK